MKRKRKKEVVLPVALLVLALAGLAIIVHTVVVLALGIGSPDQPLRFFTGGGLIAIAVVLWICFAITGGRSRWEWAENVSDQVRAMHEQESRLQRQAEMDYLASLSPEERAEQVERLTDGSSIVSMDIPDKESFLHPRNWPYGRIKPGCFD